MVVARIANLNQQNFTAEIIYPFLIPPPVPPFDRKVGFASRRNNPKRRIAAGDFRHLRSPSLLVLGKVNRSPELRKLNLQIERAVRSEERRVGKECRSRW